MWRPEDDALLERIEDEELMRRLWRAEAGATVEAPHPRSAGLIHALRAVDATGVDALAAALDEGPIDVATLRALTRPASLAGLDGKLLHQLAVFHRRVADELVDRSPEAAVVMFGRSLAAWFALGAERRYLEALIRAGLGEPSDDEVKRAFDEALTATMSELGDLARRGARELSDRALTALRALGQVAQAGKIAGAEVAFQKRMEAYADRQRAEAIEVALESVTVALGDATASGKAIGEGTRLMHRVAHIWRWADRDEHVERYAIDHVTPIAWNIYHQDDEMPRLRALLGPIEPLVDHLAWRIQDDPRRIAYAAPCAQLFVFRAEMATVLSEQRRLAERAVGLCPSHRNGRIVLAAALIHEVRERLQRLVMPSERARLKGLLDRAEALNPQAGGIDELRIRLEGAWFR